MATTSSPSPSSSFRHYIFGYGSLLCPQSRAVTAPALADRSATPAIIHHWERTWSCPFPPCGMTFLGIRHSLNCPPCVGVLVPVTDDELAVFDVRETGYNRVLIPAKDILPYHDSNNHEKGNDDEANNDNYFTNMAKSKTTRTSNDEEQGNNIQNNNKNAEDKSAAIALSPHVWIYVPQDPMPINAECPLSQTYIDIIVRGCLTISMDFCEQVLQSTRGWTSDDSHNISNSRSHQVSFHGVHWVDDRENPLYVRADADYSRQNALQIDDFLRKHRPEVLYRTTRSDKQSIIT